jgi:isoprenylcysteine carboxyl methyltransferase (ICMT) family protein YpbQ
MSMSPTLVGCFVVAALLRLGSLFVSKRNEARLRAEGAEEFGAGNTRLIALLHATFYVAAFAEGWWRGTQMDALAWFGVALYGVAMLVLLYVIRELGSVWTVKVFVAERHILNQSWLFRAVRHPNYYLNILPELLGLALAMKAWFTLTILLPCYLVALFRRIKIEEEVMRERFRAYQ